METPNIRFTKLLGIPSRDGGKLYAPGRPPLSSFPIKDKLSHSQKRMRKEKKKEKLGILQNAETEGAGGKKDTSMFEKKSESYSIFILYDHFLTKNVEVGKLILNCIYSLLALGLSLSAFIEEHRETHEIVATDAYGRQSACKQLNEAIGKGDTRERATKREASGARDAQIECESFPDCCVPFDIDNGDDVCTFDYSNCIDSSRCY